MTVGRFFVLLLLALAGFAYAVWRGHVDVPAKWNPWAPLDIREAPNLLTPFKLQRLQTIVRSLRQPGVASGKMPRFSAPEFPYDRLISVGSRRSPRSSIRRTG